MPGNRIGRTTSEGPPVAGAEVARRLLVGAVEAAEHGEHDQQPERQGPGQLRAQGRGVPVGVPAEELEHEADAEADEHQARHDQAGDGQVEHEAGAEEAAAEGEARHHRDDHGQHQDDQRQRDRALEGAGDVAGALLLRTGRRTSAARPRASGRSARRSGPGTTGCRSPTSARRGTARTA